MEEWREIKGYEDYMISNLGRVKTLNKQKGFYYIKEQIMKLKPSNTGYIQVSFGKKRYNVHRLVAEHFIPNPNKLATVNHKNEIKTDNRVDNLEWMSFKDNSRYSLLGNKNKKSKSVKQYDSNMKLIRIWNCVRDIERELNINHGCINYYCKTNKLHRDYYWFS